MMTLWLSYVMLYSTLYYDQYLENTTWRKTKDNNDTISCAKVVSVSISCSKYSILALFLYTITYLPYRLQPVFLCLSYIYSINTILYSYTLPLIYLPYSHLKSLLKCNLSSTSKDCNTLLSKFKIKIR